MRIEIRFLVVCVAVLGLLPLYGRAEDNEAQSKARAALDKMLNESQGQHPAAAAQPPAAAPVQTPAAPTAPASMALAQAEAPPILDAPPAADPAAIEKAREVMRRKMDELQSQSAATAAPPVTKTAPAPAFAQPAATPPPAAAAPPVTKPIPAPAPPPAAAVAAPAAVKAVSSPASTGFSEQAAESALNAPAPADAAATAKALEVMRQKMNEMQGQKPLENASFPPAQVGLPPQQAKTAPAPAAGLKGSPAFPPVEGPPLPISAAKDQRLQELLRRYKADEITPEQYHQQRAKILAEP
jgi:hypothetical protein